MQRIASLWKTALGKILIIGGVFIVFCFMCSVITAIFSPSEPKANVGVNASPTDVSETATLSVPTETPSPTDTPFPTDTPLPTATSTAAPEPIILTGVGDSIVDVPKGDYPAIMRAKYSSGGNFIVTNYDASNTAIDLLINTVGAYEGTNPLDFKLNEKTTRLEIKASGPWEIQILPVSQARQQSIPGTIQGTGDDVIYLNDGNPDTIIADASQASSNFILISYGDSGINLVFNEIGPYTGTALLDNDVFLISVRATGNWTLEVTTR